MITSVNLDLFQASICKHSQTSCIKSKDRPHFPARMAEWLGARLIQRGVKDRPKMDKPAEQDEPQHGGEAELDDRH
jgi:hypothetical protein